MQMDCKALAISRKKKISLPLLDKARYGFIGGWSNTYFLFVVPALEDTGCFPTFSRKLGAF
jgi:hypothetical protein